MENLDERLSAIERELGAIRTELARYKGFMGGIVFIVTALWAVIEVFGKKIGL
jgi:hypothetical protein